MITLVIMTMFFSCIWSVIGMLDSDFLLSVMFELFLDWVLL